MAPDMTPVDSSSVASVGYDEVAQELWVEFVGGRTYVYSPVPETTYQELVSAGSVGAYVNREIKPHYNCRVV
jgi:hypothetical protein